MARVDLDLARRLVSPQGQAAVAAAELTVATTTGVLAAAQALRSQVPDPALAAAALTQCRLRLRADGKLAAADAARVLLTDAGLQQATRATVARHRAQRVSAVLGGGARVLDLCCGIGGDLVELARAGLGVVGVDVDPATAVLARHNAEVLRPGAGVLVAVADATRVDRAVAAAAVVDPARRTARGRVTRPADSVPPWSFVAEVLAGTACAKVAPGIERDLVPAGVEAEWVSDGGDVVEAALWSGALGGDVRRRATLLPAGVTLTDRDDTGAPTGAVDRWLYEPDGAVIRAGLVTAVAPLAGAHLLDPRIAYLTAAERVSTPFARTFEVLDVLPYAEKPLRAWLRARGVGTLAVKKRGVGVDPAALRRAMRLRGDTRVTATVVVTRVAGRAVAIAVRPA